ncbi:hypothetical protein FACS189431_0230 [Alphaproteobacteria bacterium]|nr:hypothetical protein FACS189431_0230 [Alphaproteobacteria bacterium]
MNKKLEFCVACPDFNNHCTKQAGKTACNLQRLAGLEKSENQIYRLIVKYEDPSTYNNPNSNFNNPPYAVSDSQQDEIHAKMKDGVDVNGWSDADRHSAKSFADLYNAYNKSFKLEKGAA